jgi:copper homeostasis protein
MIVKTIIEAATESFLESKIATANGANRIELCENLTFGGTTPSFGTTKACIEVLNLPISVMIRPRGGNFVYSKEEIEIMKTDIRLLKTLGVSSFVFGVLQANNSINYDVMRELIKMCENIPVTMHRAFDELAFSHKEIEKLAAIGVKRILSAGGKGTFYYGLENLKLIQQETNKYGIELIAAGKITKDNFLEIQKLLPATAYHGRNIVCSF